MASPRQNEGRPHSDDHRGGKKDYKERDLNPLSLRWLTREYVDVLVETSGATVPTPKPTN
jgi:hypothetical protein